MAYLNFEEFQNIGGVCDETTFNKNITRVEKIIDGYTYERIKKMLTVPNEVKELCRDLVDYYAELCEPSAKNISSISQSAGPVSESISYNTKKAEEITAEVGNLIFDYLFATSDDRGTPLLYRGISTDD